MRRIACLMAVLFASPLLAQEAKPEAKPEDSRVIKLPGEIDKVIRAAGGSTLLLPMNKLGKVAIFDIKTEKITGYLNTSGGDTVVVGTADSAILIDQEKKVMQRWTLQPLAKKLTVAIPVADTILAAAAGSASNAPFVIVSKEGPQFVDSTKLKLMPVTKDENNAQQWLMRSYQPGQPMHLAAAADGSTYALGGYNGCQIFRLDGSKIVAKQNNDNVGLLTPSADGALLYSSFGLYSSDFKPLGTPDARGQRPHTFASMHPAYYLSATSTTDPRTGNAGEPNISLHNSGERTLLMTFDKLPGIGKIEQAYNQPPGTMSIADRILAYPGEKKLFIVNENRTSLHVVPLDIVKALDAKGIDYLFVESMPVTTATPGQKYEYPVKVMSKAGKVTFKLDSGPEGMTIGADGIVKWDLPKDADTGKTSVILSIEDGSKQSLFHTFKIFVTEATKVEKDAKTQP